jgi:Rrf2 family protein
MLTNKGKYGLKALVHLAQLPSGATALASAIAKAERLPKKFLDAILSELKAAGYVVSKKGPGGGYALARPASDIVVGHVVRALDGPLAPIDCASRSAFRPCDDCASIETCVVRHTMIEVREAIAAVLDGKTLADMLGKS